MGEDAGLIAGSSPRMRGAPMSRDGESWECEDHPRVCGEHTACLAIPIRQQGSSPRMRGARRSCPRSRRSGRIIPAYAGSTSYAAAIMGT